jgi:ankyrin repeat protein
LKQQDGVGETALHYCAIEGCREAVEWLASKGAAVNTHDHSNCTPLLHAAQLGHLEVCRILVAAGANLMTVDAIESDTALHAAARYGYAEVCELLLKAGAIVGATNGDGACPWDVALPRKKVQVHEVLRKYGGKSSLPTPDKN